MKRQGKSIQKKLIDDRGKRINLKSKRKKTLLKKIIEFSQLCGMDIFMVIHDTEIGRVIQYTSGTIEKGLFDLDKAKEVLEQAKGSTKWYDHITNDDYSKFLRNSQFLEEEAKLSERETSK